MSNRDANMSMAQALAKKVDALGGRCYFVGGYVRDKLMGIESKDIDIEVHGLTPERLKAVLDSLGERITIGESFGIFNLKGYDLDIAMPRMEALRGKGHRDFEIFVDPFIGTKSAAMRRDFTFNALMLDVISGQLIDHFGGAADLKKGVLRHVNDASFGEDPLRVLRCAQFAARFGFSVCDETLDLCRKMDLSHLPRERIEAELAKALLKAERPSVFFQILRQMEQLDVWFPELKALIGVEQSPLYHAEGDVWNHTMMVIDEAAKLRGRIHDPLLFMYSAIVHDFGKAVSTEIINGAIHAIEHEIKGLPLVERFIRRISAENRLLEYTLNMTELHMLPLIAAVNNASIKTTNKIFDRSVEPEGLILLSLSDDRGRISEKPLPPYEDFLYERLRIYRDYMSRPCVTGKDLIDAGFCPGKDFREILAYSHKLHLAGIKKEDALKQTLAYARKIRK